MPKVYNDPMLDVKDHLDEIGFRALGAVMPLQDLLAARLICFTTDYSDMIVKWIREFTSDLPIIGNWLALHGLTVDDNCDHLLTGGPADGLEIWTASQAMAQSFNIVFETVMWGTAHNGVDFIYPIMLLTSNSKGMWCVPKDQEQPMLVVTADPTAATTDTLPDVVISTRPKMGCPTVHDSPVQIWNSSEDSTDPDELFSEEISANVPVKLSGIPRPCTCPICSDQLSSGLALERHLKQMHPLSHCFKYNSCEATFNNLHKVSSHRSNVHRPHRISCKECNFTAVSQARM